MDRNTVLAMWLLHRRRKRRRVRNYWVQPMLQIRDEFRTFYTLLSELREDQMKFFNYFHMSISSFDELHRRLRSNLQHQDTKMRNCIQPTEMLAVAIRYLASGCSFTDLHYSHQIGISTASKIVREVCSSIWSLISEECIPRLTKDQWELIAMDYERRANFPHCIGAVDGKHIRIMKPEHSGLRHYNYKHYFSVVLMAVADSSYRFVYVDIGSYGKECDSTIFKQSRLWRSIQENVLELPRERPLTESEGPDVPYFFVGDEAFALNKNLLRPFGGHNMSMKKRVYNYRLCRARRYVECTFAILSNKWKILNRPLNVNIDFAVDIVKACVVLHNFVRDRDGYSIEDAMTVTGLEDVPPGESVRGGLTANGVRNLLADYFLTEAGALPWQMAKLQIGVRKA